MYIKKINKCSNRTYKKKVKCQNFGALYIFSQRLLSDTCVVTNPSHVLLNDNMKIYFVFFFKYFCLNI